jgi:hypothetical protein
LRKHADRGKLELQEQGHEQSFDFTDFILVFSNEIATALCEIICIFYS